LVLAIAFHPTDEGSLAFVMECTVSQHKIPHGSGGGFSIRAADLKSRRLEWCDRRFADFKKRDIPLLAPRLQEYNAKAPPSCTASTAAAMKESFWVGGRIELHDKVDLWNVKTSCGNIGGKKDSGLDSGDKAGKVLLADLWQMFSM
jgi:hypothetical protein